MNAPYDPLLSKDPLRITRNRLLSRTSEPASEPVSLSEAKLYLRVDDSNEDALITDCIVASRLMAEQWLGRSLITQSWKLAFDLAIADSVWLPMGPVTSILSIVIFNQDGSSSTLAANTYWLNAAKNAVEFDTIFSGFRIEISYNTGYGVAAAVPKPIKMGILAHIASIFDARGDAVEAGIPEQSMAFYRPYREVRL